MSWAEENGIDIYDPEYDSPHFRHFTSYTPNPRTWMTKEGVVLPIAQMSDSHLSNAINSMLKQKRQPYYLLEEYYLRNKDNK